MATATPVLQDARATHRRGDWPSAWAGFSRASDEGLPMDADDLLAAAQAAWWCGQTKESMSLSARAHRQLLAAGRIEDAARAAIDVATYHLLMRQIPFGAGWMARAARLLAELPESPALGYLIYFRDVEWNLAEASPDGVLAAARRITKIAGQHDDPTLDLMAQAAEGHALVGAGHVAAGIGLLDEVMIRLDPGTIAPDWVGNIYCIAVEVAHRVGDVARMRLWVEASEQWLDTLPTAALFTGACRVYRAQLWQLTGEWERAEQVLDLVASELDRLCRETSGTAWLLRGELRLLTDDTAGAENAFTEAHRRGTDPQPGLALLQLRRGDVAGARAAARAALSCMQSGHLHHGARLLMANIRIACAASDLDEAERRAEELNQLAGTWPESLVRPMAATASGAIALARGLPHEALGLLRSARDRWRELDAPYEAACTGRLLAGCYRALGDHGSAGLEADAAAEMLDRLHALPAWPDPEPTTPPQQKVAGLTAREVQVLALLADGLRNADIGRDLCISPRTVERHLSNIYGKLGIVSRAAATRYAVEHRVVPVRP